MSKSRIKLWIDAESGQLYESFGSNTPAQPLVFLQGDALDMELHLVRLSSGFNRLMEEVPFPAGCTVRLAIGKVSAAPTSGTFALTYGTETTTISYAATAAQIQTALNAMTSITAAGGVLVSKTSNALIKVDFNQVGANLALSVNGNLLSPPTASRVVVLQTGSSSIKGSFLIKLKQSPVVFQNSWTDLEQPTLTVTELTANQAKRVSISPEPKAGTWSLTGTADIYTKAANNGNVIDPAWWDETYSGRFSINALETESGFAQYQYSVAKVDNYIWDFSLKSYGVPPVGYTMPFVALGDGLVGFKGKTAFVDLNTAEIEYLLDGAASATTNLEIEIESSTNKKWTVLQTTCTIKNDLIDQSTFSPLSFDEGVTEAPYDGALYARKNGSWFAFIPEDNAGITDAPADDTLYARKNNAWITFTPEDNIGIPEAPVDGTPYLRKDGDWSADIDGGTY